tara:strand:- start:6871 stop:7458 length:588 start_codon:yes stop_codon:yes gene_type:complete
MHRKITTFSEKDNHIVAGLQENDNIEFYGIKATREVRYLMNGKTYQWRSLPKEAFALLFNAYQKDEKAKELLNRESPNLIRQVELYAYYMYGDLDHKADLQNGYLQQNENFRHSKKCISRLFSRKKFKVGSKKLNQRDITIIDMIALDALDTEIAHRLGVTTSTLGFHKKNLFIKLDCQTKTGVLYKAMRSKLIN